MPSIRDSIDEMIEESYLLGLSKSEIKADLDRFVEICGKIIHENVHDRKQIQKLTEKLARARALSLIEEHHEEDPEQDAVLPDGKKAVGSSRGRFAERVARNKRLILRTINDCDPLLLQLIEQARFPGRSEEYFSQPLGRERPVMRSRAKDLFLRGCTLVTLIGLLLLVYLVLLQNV